MGAGDEDEQGMTTQYDQLSPKPATYPLEFSWICIDDGLKSSLTGPNH